MRGVCLVRAGLVKRSDVPARATYHRHNALNTCSARWYSRSASARRVWLPCKLKSAPTGGRLACYAAKRELDPQTAEKVCQTKQGTRAFCCSPPIGLDEIDIARMLK
eukprot:2230330-Pyramimonas_sp.AAC.1